MNILVIDAHPSAESLCAALASGYAAGAAQAGATVCSLAVRDMDFDPVLHEGRRGAQRVEEAVREAREALDAADHVAVVTPVWWGSVPAGFKGFLDRVMEAGWAYRYDERGRPEGLLRGRSAHVLITSDSPAWYLRLVAGDTTARMMRRAVLGFCGMAPVELTRFPAVRARDDATRARWCETARAAGRSAAGSTPRHAKRAAPVLRHGAPAAGVAGGA